jgi:hypothetical protein
LIFKTTNKTKFKIKHFDNIPQNVNATEEKTESSIERRKSQESQNH